jgi:hypothetical protein
MKVTALMMNENDNFDDEWKWQQTLIWFDFDIIRHQYDLVWL